MPIAFSFNLTENKRLGFELRSNQSINRMNQTPKGEKQVSFIKKFGKWAPLVGAGWIVLNIVVPLAMLRIPAVQKYLVVLDNKLPFDIPGIG